MTSLCKDYMNIIRPLYFNLYSYDIILKLCMLLSSFFHFDDHKTLQRRYFFFGYSERNPNNVIKIPQTFFSLKSLVSCLSVKDVFNPILTHFSIAGTTSTQVSNSLGKGVLTFQTFILQVGFTLYVRFEIMSFQCK